MINKMACPKCHSTEIHKGFMCEVYSCKKCGYGSSSGIKEDNSHDFLVAFLKMEKSNKISQLETQLLEKDKLIQELKDELRKEREFADSINKPDEISESDTVDGVIPKQTWFVRWRHSAIERARQRIKERKEF